MEVPTIVNIILVIMANGTADVDTVKKPKYLLSYKADFIAKGMDNIQRFN